MSARINQLLHYLSIFVFTIFVSHQELYGNISDQNNDTFKQFVQVSEGDLQTKLNDPKLKKLKTEVDELSTELKAEFFADFNAASFKDLLRIQKKDFLTAWKENIRSSDLKVLKESFKTAKLRDEYAQKVSDLSKKKVKLLRKGYSIEKIAEILFEDRRNLTIEYKGITPDDILKWIFKRNIIVYRNSGKGDEWGATYTGLIAAKAKKKGIDLKTATEEQMNQLYESIANGASKNSGATKQVLGKVFYTFFKNHAETTPEELKSLEAVLKKHRMLQLQEG